MIDQINSSIEFDCDNSYWNKRLSELRILPAKDWYENQLKDIEKNILYHTEENTKEIESVEGRTKWVMALKNSLK